VIEAESVSVEIVTEKLFVDVTFDERRGYVARSPELRAPVVALSLGGLHRQIESATMPVTSTRRRGWSGIGVGLPVGNVQALPGRRP